MELLCGKKEAFKFELLKAYQNGSGGMVSANGNKGIWSARGDRGWYSSFECSSIPSLGKDSNDFLDATWYPHLVYKEVVSPS